MKGLGEKIMFGFISPALLLFFATVFSLSELNRMSIMTPGAAIIVVLMFFFLIDLCFVHPVTQINRNLRNCLNDKVPSSVKIEGCNEVYHLREAIEILIQMLKNKKTE